MAQMTLAERIDALSAAAELADGRVDVDQARAMLNRAKGRLAQTTDQTVVALAGATGSGKSSLFNALTRTTLAEPGVLRPTTTVTRAGTFGDSAALLDWLDVPTRHEIRGVNDRLAGLVLLDLPDHDSMEVSHKAEVDRLAQVVDQLIFVVDPQKYADAALHGGYLRPLAGHHGVLHVVLNQVDLLSGDDRAMCLADLRRILAEGGLANVPVHAVSAMTGEGIDALRDDLATAVRRKTAASARLAAEVASAASGLRARVGAPAGDLLTKQRVRELCATLACAAGAETVARAAGDATRYHGAIATGWPFVSWLRALRPDPLHRLRLGRRRIDRPVRVEVSRTSLQKGEMVQEARIASAIRVFGYEAAEGLPDRWRDAVLVAGRQSAPTLPGDLDTAVASTDLSVGPHAWWGVLRVLQWMLMTAVIAGGGWLLVNAVLTWTMPPPLPTPLLGSPHGFRIAVPTALLVGGALAGMLFDALARVVIAFAARATEASARSALRTSVAMVAEERVVAPIRAELTRHDEAAKLLARLA